jgi:endonuclease/exonuclease/phosphatase (EEP) superfamily protein YafD
VTITNPDPDAATDVEPAPAPPPRGRRIAGAVMWWLLVLPGALWAAVRLGGWERGPLVQLFAFTPYVAGWTLLPAAVTLVRHRWAPAAVAWLAVIAMTACVLPRAVPDTNSGAKTGTPLHVLTANMLVGGADPGAIVGLVWDNDVEVLAVQEFTPDAAAALAGAGLADALPYSQLGPEVGTTGSGLYSRYPITAGGVRRNPGAYAFLQAYGTIQKPGAPAVLVESAHPMAPGSLDAIKVWRDDLDAEPRATPKGPLRILLGDFNSTLDHTPLRRLIASGYTDAADAVGEGLIGTWGPYVGDPIPPVTIDHVLVDRRIGVRAVTVNGVDSSDHRAVFASLTLPAG